jgi:hypothetical protein
VHTLIVEVNYSVAEPVVVITKNENKQKVNNPMEVGFCMKSSQLLDTPFVKFLSWEVCARNPLAFVKSFC